MTEVDYRPSGRLMRFAVDDLERDGRAWNATHRLVLHTRPQPDWPLMPAVVRKDLPPELD